MKREGIKGVLGTFATDPIDLIQEKVFHGCPVHISGITPMTYGDRNAVLVSFDIGDARVFPSLLENFRTLRSQYKSTMNVFLGNKKVNLDAFK